MLFSHLIAIPLFWLVQSGGESTGLFRLEVATSPVGGCDGSLRSIVKRVIAAQPEGYMSTKEFRKKLERENRYTDAYPKLYRREIPMYLGTQTLPLVSIVELKELPGVHLAFASERLLMNALTLRASESIEAKLVLSGNKLFSNTDMVNVAGHDLKRSDLFAFWKGTRSDLDKSDPLNKLRGQNKLLRLVERDFWIQWMVPRLIHDRNFKVFISSDVGKETLETVGHETLHAQFFTDVKFREIILHYWRHKLSDLERQQLISGLLPGYGNIHRDEMLAANEFMAYTLSPRAIESLQDLPKDSKLEWIKGMRSLIPLVKDQRPKLFAYLKAKGIRPVEVKF